MWCWRVVAGGGASSVLLCFCYYSCRYMTCTLIQTLPPVGRPIFFCLLICSFLACAVRRPLFCQKRWVAQLRGFCGGLFGRLALAWEDAVQGSARRGLCVCLHPSCIAALLAIRALAPALVFGCVGGGFRVVIIDQTVGTWYYTASLRGDSAASGGCAIGPEAFGKAYLVLITRYTDAGTKVSLEGR